MKSAPKVFVFVLSAIFAASLCSAFQTPWAPLGGLQRVQHGNHVTTFRMSEESSATEEPAEAEESVDPSIVCPNCDLCDGSGRIAGGIGAVLPWIPIKAYRPCPNFIERGGNYQRAGQGLDEIAFGKKTD